MNDLIAPLVASAPQVLFLVLVVAAAAIALREFRSIRRELADEIGTRVKAEFGALLGDLLKQAELARAQVAEMTELQRRLQLESDKFESQLKESSVNINKLVAEVRLETEQFRELVPRKEELEWVSPHDAVVRARTATTWRDAYQFLSRFDEENATSFDLEIAGDVYKEFRHFRKALEFYRRSIERDPENVSCRAELLALTAETRPTERDQALEQLEALVLATPSNDHLAKRFFNVLVDLKRWTAMSEFSSRQLERKQELPPETAAMLHRNLAVALGRQGRASESLSHYDAAIALTPRDENSLRAYARLLRDLGRHDEAQAYYRQLIEIDPTDANYYSGLAQIFSKKGRLDKALALFEIASRFANSTQEVEIAQELRKLKAWIAVRPLVADNPAAAPGEGLPIGQPQAD